MKSLKFTFGILALALCATINSASAQVTVSGGGDFVSSYIWRGSFGSGASFQPYAEVSTGGFAVGAWGSTDLNAPSKEFDYYVSYSVGNFSVGITDYWWLGEGCSYFGGGHHYYEAALGYTISESFPLSLSVSTMFAGADDTNSKDEQAYSTYIELAYPLEVSDIAIDLAVGVTPADGMYASEFGVCNLSARFSKSLTVTDTFELPVFVDAIINPAGEQAFLVFGTSLSF